MEYVVQQYYWGSGPVGACVSVSVYVGTCICAHTSMTWPLALTIDLIRFPVAWQMVDKMLVASADSAEINTRYTHYVVLKNISIMYLTDVGNIKRSDNVAAISIS